MGQLNIYHHGDIMGKVYSLNVVLNEANDWLRYTIYGLNMKDQFRFLDFLFLEIFGDPRCLDSTKMPLIQIILARIFGINISFSPQLSSWYADILVAFVFFTIFSRYFIHVMQ